MYGTVPYWSEENIPLSSASGPSASGCAGRRGRGRDDAILTAALELLAEVGYDRMSMDALARQARASKATIYRRWPGKREVVLDALRSRAMHEVDLPDTGGLRSDLLAALRVNAAAVAPGEPALIAGVMRAMHNSPELAVCMRDQVMEAKRDISRALVDRAVARGELAQGCDGQVVHEVTSALIWMRLLVCGEPIDEAFILHITDDILLPLLQRQPQSPHPTDPTDPEST